MSLTGIVETMTFAFALKGHVSVQGKLPKKYEIFLVNEPLKIGFLKNLCATFTRYF